MRRKDSLVLESNSLIWTSREKEYQSLFKNRVLVEEINLSLLQLIWLVTGKLNKQYTYSSLNSKTKFENFYHFRSGGDWSTTYAPSPFYMTSKMRSLYLEGYEYSVFDLTKNDRVQIQVAFQ